MEAMSETETSEPSSDRFRLGGGAAIVPFPSRRKGEEPSEAHGHQSSPPVPRGANVVSFDARELREILNVYGRMVALGEWRDYALDFMKDRAVFSVFRRTSEVPLYRIEKDPRLARRQGAYSVVSASGRILKRGHDLARVLQVLDKPVRLVAR
jgi:hypothetical protein